MARRLIADLLRGIGLPYPRDLAVLLQSVGYRGAFCTAQGVLHTSGTRWTLARVPGLTQPLERFAGKLRGWRERALLVLLGRALASQVRGAGIAA